MKAAAFEPLRWWATEQCGDEEAAEEELASELLDASISEGHRPPRPTMADEVIAHRMRHAGLLHDLQKVWAKPTTLALAPPRGGSPPQLTGDEWPSLDACFPDLPVRLPQSFPDTQRPGGSTVSVWAGGAATLAALSLSSTYTPVFDFGVGCGGSGMGRGLGSAAAVLGVRSSSRGPETRLPPRHNAPRGLRIVGGNLLRSGALVTSGSRRWHEPMGDELESCFDDSVVVGGHGGVGGLGGGAVASRGARRRELGKHSRSILQSASRARAIEQREAQRAAAAQAVFVRRFGDLKLGREREEESVTESFPESTRNPGEARASL